VITAPPCEPAAPPDGSLDVAVDPRGATKRAARGPLRAPPGLDTEAASAAALPPPRAPPEVGIEQLATKNS